MTTEAPASQFTRLPAITKPSKSVRSECHRCGGEGGSTCWNHTGYVCFRCNGSRVDPTDRRWGFPAEWSDQQCREFLNKREAANEVARARKANKEHAAYLESLKALDEQIPGVLWVLGDEMVEDASEVGGERLYSFERSKIREMAGKAAKFSLSEKQIAWIGRMITEVREKIDRATEKAEQMKSVPVLEAGRRPLTGTIKSTKWSNGQFPALKMILELPDGNRLYGTIPNKIVDAAADRDLVGLTVEIVAEVQLSNDDPHFGFFSKPTKPAIIN